jgi:hypothetical protein
VVNRPLHLRFYGPRQSSGDCTGKGPEVHVKTAIRALIVLIMLGASAPGGAAGSIQFPVTPDPEACTVEPLTTDSLIDLYNVEEPATIERTVTSEAASNDDVEAAVDVVVMSIACSNANQPLAALALTTDRFQANLFWSEAGQDELGHLIAASSRTPEPAAEEDWLTIESISNAVVYDDNSLGFDLETSNRERLFEDRIVLTQESGEWLIDQVIVGNESPRATPAAVASLLPKP